MKFSSRLRGLIVASATLAVALLSVSADAGRHRAELDHVGAYNFMVEISGVNAGYFKGVDGLSAEIEVIEYQDGSDVFLRKRPGRAKYGDITLKRGVIDSKDLQDWWKQSREGKARGREVTLTLQKFATKKGVRVEGAKAQPLCAYTFKGTQLKDIQETETKAGKEVQLVVSPARVTHTCKKFMLEPGQQPKAQLERQG